jgi:hypothetical protein
MKNGVVFFLGLLLLNSCTTVVNLTRTEPPEMVLEPKPAKVVFSNQFDYLSNPGIKDKHEVAYQTGIARFAASLSKDSIHKEPVLIFQPDTSGREHQEGQLVQTNKDSLEIINICRVNQCDFLLSLDSLRLHFDWEVIREEDEMDGSVSKTKDFYLICNYYVTLYDSIGSPLKRTLLERSLFYKSRPTLGALITILPNLANATGQIALLAHDAAMEYLGMFYPSQVIAGQRSLHTGKIFEASNNLIFSKDYDKAIQMLEQLPYSGNKGKAKKIQHNLSVAQELKQLQESSL